MRLNKWLLTEYGWSSLDFKLQEDEAFPARNLDGPAALSLATLLWESAFELFFPEDEVHGHDEGSYHKNRSDTVRRR